MTDKRLKIFVAVAEAGSFTEAAHRLKMSQPAVSQSIAQTEKEIGGTLVERGDNPLVLTDKGRILYAWAVRILSLYDSLNADLTGNGTPSERAILSLADGRSADICVRNGKIEIDIKNN